MCKSVTINWHTFLTRGLSHDSVIVDAGANCGAFSIGIKESFGASAFAIEPQPKAASKVRERGIRSCLRNCA